MFFGLSYEAFKLIYVKVIEVLVVFLTGMIAYRFSILNTIREQKMIKKQAFTDPLTGGGNRQLFLKVVDDLIAKKKKFALCFLDLDGFKQVNDRLGHDAGDKLLIELHTTLKNQLIDKNGSAYRLGGDEFAIVLTKFNTTEDIAKILDGLKEAFKKPIMIENTNIYLEYSLGVAIYPNDANNRKDLLSYADDSMYYIKEHGKNSYYFHNKVLKAKVDNKTKMEVALKNAYVEHQFSVALQPRLNISDPSIMTFEALVYWNHPVLGYLKAEYFIKQAETLGIIINLDELVLKTCCEKLKQMKDKGYENIKICVNLSNRHCRRSDFVESLCNILTSYSLKKGDIQLEFTDIIKEEEIEEHKYMMDKLKQCGVTIAVTSVPVEYSLAELLLQLPIDEVKINGQFIQKESKFSPSVLNDIIRLSKDFGYLVSVTHIDHKEEIEKLVKYQIDKIQGDYIYQRFDIQELYDYALNFEKKYLLKYQEIIKNAKMVAEKTNNK